MTFPHVVIWLDHREATIIKFSPETKETSTVRSHHDGGKIHTKSGSSGSGHVPDDADFFDSIVQAASQATEAIVVGPGLAKIAFERYAHSHHAAFAKRIVAVETLDHPTEGELLALARKSFKAVDQLLGDG